MSHLTKCCYCSLERIKKRAEAANLEVRILPVVSTLPGGRTMAMLGVYLVAGEPQRTPGDPLPFTGKAPQSYGEPVVQLGELTTHCVC